MQKVCEGRGAAPPGAVADGPARHHDPVDAEDFRQVRDAVRQLIRDAVVPREEQIEDEDAIPDVLREKAAEMGLFGYALPEEYGGVGVVITQEPERGVVVGYTTPALPALFGPNKRIAGP